MPLAEINGVRLLVEESGRGDPLVLVHGSWDEHRIWAPVEPRLAERSRVIRYDRRGHTASEDGAVPGTRRDDEDDLAALIEERCDGPVDVVANSFGGSIALGLAARRPELFRSLCAHEPPLMGLAADNPLVQQFNDALLPVVVGQVERGEDEAAARTFVEGVVGPGGWELLPEEERASLTRNAGTFAEETRDPAGFEIDLDGLDRADFPILLTQGDQSPPFFAAIIARLAEAADGVEVATIKGAGHVPHATHPDEYVALIGRFAG